MKEIEILQQDKLEVSAQKPILKGEKLIGKIRPQRGHTTFEINIVTGEVLEAQYSAITVELKEIKSNELSVKKKKIITNENCVYISALNKDNAKKKFNNLVKQKQNVGK